MATFSPEYHALAAEGRAWYDAQVRAMNGHSVYGDATLPAIPPHYTFDTSAPGLPGVVAATSSSLNQLGHWGEYRFVELKDADEAVADDVGSIYESYVHVGGKAIICTSIHKEYDRYNNLPGQIFFSQFLATACSSVSRAGGRDGKMRGLEAIWCYWVENEQTERIVEEIFRARRVQSLPTVDVCVGSDDFFALLATQNGKSVARMLGSYPSISGRRMVSRIRLFPRFDGPKVLLGEKTFVLVCRPYHPRRSRPGSQEEQTREESAAKGAIR